VKGTLGVGADVEGGADAIGWILQARGERPLSSKVASVVLWPSLTAEGATTNGGDAIHCGRRCLERPLYNAPLPLVANNWPALDDPKQNYAWISSLSERGLRPGVRNERS